MTKTNTEFNTARLSLQDLANNLAVSQTFFSEKKMNLVKNNIGTFNEYGESILLYLNETHTLMCQNL